MEDLDLFADWLTEKILEYIDNDGNLSSEEFTPTGKYLGNNFFRIWFTATSCLEITVKSDKEYSVTSYNMLNRQVTSFNEDKYKMEDFEKDVIPLFSQELINLCYENKTGYTDLDKYGFNPKTFKEYKKLFEI